MPFAFVVVGQMGITLRLLDLLDINTPRRVLAREIAWKV